MLKIVPLSAGVSIARDRAPRKIQGKPLSVADYLAHARIGNSLLIDFDFQGPKIRLIIAIKDQQVFQDLFCDKWFIRLPSHPNISLDRSLLLELNKSFGPIDTCRRGHAVSASKSFDHFSRFFRINGKKDLVEKRHFGSRFPDPLDQGLAEKRSQDFSRESRRSETGRNDTYNFFITDHA
jgi:hypothetical protein